VTFGESMLRLSVPEGERLETATDLEMRVAGAESNVAVAASRLGATAGWLSKLPDSPLARRIEHALRGHGVAPLVARGEGRVGTYYIEPGGRPRGTNVVYDRDGAAVRTATPEDLALAAVRGAEVFHTSGITPALSGTLADTTRELLRTAREAGVRTTFDLNYRSKLWSPAAARERCEGLFEFVDTLFVPERDARAVLGYEGEPDALAAALADDHAFETVVLTRGAEGALARHDGRTIDQPAVEADTFDPVGTGDAFVGAFLASRLDGGGVPAALEYGAAAAALKRTIAGDVATVTPAEVERLLDETADDRSLAR
jgi:2-dehydro-3-deoxygluconokinase